MQRWILKRPADLAKDQTYFLFGLTQEQLAHTLFPLGRMTKPEVREVARRHGLALAEKPDSQEICFIPGGDYKQFLTAYLEEQGEPMPETDGELVTSSGEVLGHHRASPISPWASARGSRSPRHRRSTYSRSIRPATASRSAPMRSWPRARCAPTASTGSAFPR